MLILGIESSCDETAAAVVRMDVGERVILSNVVASQIETHALYGGVVPEIASRAHIEAVSSVCEKALDDAGIKLSEVDAIGVTYTPGLIGSLLVGVNFAKSLAFSTGIPLVPVDHIKAHTAAAYFDNSALSAPFVSVVVSGGHTSIYNVPSPTVFDEIGSTRDDAAGEAFDKVGRVMGLSYPGGSEMDRLAASGFSRRSKIAKKDRIIFPSPSINDDTLDFSFSGLKTACVNYIHNLRQKNGLSDRESLTETEKEDIAAAFTESVVDGVCKKLGEALSQTETKSLVLAGGVAANSHLRRGISALCEKTGTELYMPRLHLCGDNGVMVAGQTYFEFLEGARADTSINAYASGESVPIMCHKTL